MFHKFLKLQAPFRRSKTLHRASGGSGLHIHCAFDLLELRPHVRQESFLIAQNLLSQRSYNDFMYCSMTSHVIHLSSLLSFLCCQTFLVVLGAFFYVDVLVFSSDLCCHCCHLCSPEVASISGWSWDSRYLAPTLHASACLCYLRQLESFSSLLEIKAE